MAASLEQVLARIHHWTSPRLGELADTALLERFVHGRDESAFAALVARHGDMVLRSCRRVLGDEHQAEDAFQATFLILARKAATLKQPDALAGWLHGVARRVALKARCRDKKPACRATGGPSVATFLPDPLTQLTARELLTVLDEEVARLPLAQGSAVLLCCVEGRTQEEAARQLGCTAGSLKGHLERGRKRLQERLRRRCITLSAALAIVAVSRGEAMSALLLRSTIAAALSGAGNSAAAMAHSVLKAMFLAKLAGMTALIVAVTLAASATIALVQRRPAAEAPEDPERGRLARQLSGRDARAPAPRMDAHGDPLPDGAIARLGSPRWRQAEKIDRLAFTPDGKRLVSQGQDGGRVWDVATGKELRHIAPKAVQTWAASDLSPDGKWLAGRSNTPTLGRDAPIELWDLESGKKIGDVGEGYCYEARFSPDGKLLAISSMQKEISLWDLKSRKKLRAWEPHPRQVWTIDFSADSRKLLTSGTTSEIRLWDVATGRLLQEFKPLGPQTGLIQTPYSMDLSPDGKLLAVIEANEKQTSAAGKVEWKARLSLRDTASGKLVRLILCTAKEIRPGFAPPFAGLRFRRDGKKLLTGGPDDSLREWEVATGKELRRIALPPGRAYLLAVSPDNKQLAAASFFSSAIRLVDLASGKPHTESMGHLSGISHALLTPDGRTAVTCSFKGSALVWDVATGTVRGRFDGEKHGIFSLQLAADGGTVFSIADDTDLHVWDIATGKQRRAVKVNRDRNVPVWGGVAVSPDGKTVAVVDRGGTLRVLDAQTAQERQRFRAAGSMCGLALPPDGRTLIGWSDDRKLHVWDIATGAERGEYSLPTDPKPANALVANLGMGGRYFRAALSPDGRLFAMGTQDLPMNEVKPETCLVLKDVTTGQDVQRIANPPADAEVLAFSPDGRTLAYSGASDATIRLLEVASGRERHRLAGHRGRVNALSFSARGDRLISGCNDTTALIWDLGVRPDPHPAAPESLKRLWSDLAGVDAVAAYRAIRKLAASPTSAVPFLRAHLHPAAAVDAKRLARLLTDLDSDDFAKREAAAAELRKIGEQALPAYRKVLEGKPTLETRRRLRDLREKANAAYWDVSGDRLRSLRAVEALELAGTADAREVLKTLAGGAAEARRTEEARKALERLANGRR